MSDNTNDTYLDEDAFGTPCLWLVSHPTGPELLLSKDDIRIAVNKHKPFAHWGAPSRDIYVERAWDAIAATTEPAPVTSREAVAQAIEQAASDVDLAKYFLPGTTDRFVDALLAAGVVTS